MAAVERDYVNKSVAQIVIDTAANPAKTLLFNYASEALNNDFFLDCLVSSTLPFFAH
jgi:hypothetical protein